MITLTAEEVKKKYGEQALQGFTATPEQKPGYLSRVGSEFSQSATNAAQAEIASGNTMNPLAAGASIAKNVTNAVISPITQSAPAQFVSSVASPVVHAVLSKLGDTPAGKAFKALAAKHPELTQALGDITQTGLNVAAIEGTVSGVKGAYNLTKTGVNNTVQGTKDLISSGKQSIYGGEQPNFVDNLLSPKLSAGNTSKLIKGGKVVEGQGLLGQRDFSQAIPGFQDIKNAVAEVPNISPRNTFLENVNAIHSEIGTVAKDLESQVAQEKSFFSPNKFKSLMNDVKSTLGENPTIVGDAETAASKVATKFESLVKEYGYNSKGLLQARKALDRWILVQKGAKVFSPSTESGITTAISEIRQAGNKFLAEISPNSPVIPLLQKQTNLYRAIDLIAPKAATEGNSLLSQYVKANPVMVGAGKLLLEGTAMGKAARLLQ